MKYKAIISDDERGIVYKEKYFDDFDEAEIWCMTSCPLDLYDFSILEKGKNWASCCRVRDKHLF